MSNCSSPKIKKGSGCTPIPEWITLPVAPHAAARSRFAGSAKLPQAVPVYGALNWMDDLKGRGVAIAGVDIDGPGDPLATLDMTLEVLALIRDKQPDIALAVTTLGMGLSKNIDKLVRHGVSRVTLLVDSVSSEVIANLYSWIRPEKRNIPIAKGAAILIEEQARGISACRSAGIAVTIRTTVYPGVNEGEVEDIALFASGFGAESMTILPGQGWKEGEEEIPLDAPSAEIMATLNTVAAAHISTGAPPVGQGLHQCLAHETCSCGSPELPKATSTRPNVAALSSNGMDIDLHLGQAIKALIYGPREDGLPCLLETRDLPEPGCGEQRWLRVAEVLDDCFVLLAESAGQKPRDILGKSGLPIILIDDNVEGTVDVLYTGGKKGKCKK